MAWALAMHEIAVVNDVARARKMTENEPELQMAASTDSSGASSSTPSKSTLQPTGC